MQCGTWNDDYLAGTLVCSQVVTSAQFCGPDSIRAPNAKSLLQQIVFSSSSLSPGFDGLDWPQPRKYRFGISILTDHKIINLMFSPYQLSKQFSFANRNLFLSSSHILLDLEHQWIRSYNSCKITTQVSRSDSINSLHSTATGPFNKRKIANNPIVLSL